MKDISDISVAAASTNFAPAATGNSTGSITQKSWEKFHSPVARLQKLAYLDEYLKEYLPQDDESKERRREEWKRRQRLDAAFSRLNSTQM